MSVERKRGEIFFLPEGRDSFRDIWVSLVRSGGRPSSLEVRLRDCALQNAKEGSRRPMQTPDLDRLHPCAFLSEAQRQCLRMVRDLHTSKEIAIRLGISPHTVDARIRRIIEKLGVSSRTEAAKLLSKYEADYQPLIYQAPVLDDDACFSDHSPATAVADIVYPTSDQLEGGASEIRDSCGEAEPDAEYRWTASSSRASAGGVKWGKINGMGITQRISLIILIATLSALSFGGLISGVAALQAIVP